MACGLWGCLPHHGRGRVDDAAEDRLGGFGFSAASLRLAPVPCVAARSPPFVKLRHYRLGFVAATVVRTWRHSTLPCRLTSTLRAMTVSPPTARGGYLRSTRRPRAEASGSRSWANSQGGQRSRAETAPPPASGGRPPDRAAGRDPVGGWATGRPRRGTRRTVVCHQRRPPLGRG
jgi:hypothetical protein